MSAKITIKLRRDTGTNWTSVNPVLANGEAGFNTTTNQIKVGNGTDTWANLQYLSAAAGSSLISGNSNVVIDAVNGNLLVAVTGNANVLTANSTLVKVSSLTANGNSQFNQDVTVSGNLTVVGTQNIFNIQSVTVANPIIYVNDDATDDTEDPGLVGQYAEAGNIKYTGIVRDHTDATWKVFDNLPTLPGNVVDWANARLANFKAGNITTTGDITTTGNLSANNITANFYHGDGSNLTNIAPGNAITNGNSNAIVTVNGNINVSVAGNANIVTFTDTGVNVNGTLSVTGKSNLGDIANVTLTGGNSGEFLFTDGAGNLSFGVVNVSTISNGISSISIPVANGNVVVDAGGTANMMVISASNIGISGNLTTSANVDANILTANILIGTLDTDSNAQPNITSLGTLSNLSVDGNVTFANGNVTLGDIGNIHVTGGNSGELLSTDGAGNLSWISPTAQTIDAWTLTNSYSVGKLVRYQGALWSANDVIPANTAFTIGTSGATWAPVDQLTGLNTITLSSYSTSTTLNASTTVDIATALNIPQVTSGIALTLPTPTLSTQPRTLIINNTGVASVLVKGYTLNPGWSVMALWTGSVWQLAVPDPNTATWSFLDDSSGVSFSGLSGTAFTQNVAIATTATSNVSAGANGFVTGVLSSTGRYTVVGGGNVIHTGNLVYTGNTTIGTNTLMTFTGNGRLGGGSYANVINAQGTFNYQASNNQTLSGVVSGVGGITMNSHSYTLTLSSNSTYTGNTRVMSGNLRIGANGSGGLLANASNILVYGNANTTGTLEFKQYYANSQTISLAANITGNGNIYFNGSNLASNSYYNIDAATYTAFSGNWIVTGARVISNHSVGASKVYVTTNGSQWYVSGSNAWTNDWYLAGNGLTGDQSGVLRIEQANASTLSGNVNISSGTLIQTSGSAGNVTFTGNLNANTGSANAIIAANVPIYYKTPNTSVAYTLNWANANNSGITTLTQGAFNANSVNSFGNLSTLTMGEGNAVNLNINANANAGGLSGSYTNANMNVVANTTTFTFGGNDSNTTYLGTISGAGSLTKVGNGTTRISANASYTGLTTINRGRLIFGNGTATYLPGTGNIVLSVANANANSDAVSTVRFDSNTTGATLVRTFIGNGNVEFYGTGETTQGQGTWVVANGFANFNGNVVVNTGAYLRADNMVFSNTAANGIVTVASNAQLDLRTTANFYSPITISGNGHNLSGGPEGALTLQSSNANITTEVTNNITLAANSFISARSNINKISGNITGNFNVRFTANAGTTPVLVLSGSNSNFANTTIYGSASGTVRVDNTGAIPANTVMYIAGGGGNVTFAANANVSVGSLAGDANTLLNIANANFTVTTGNLNSNTTYAGFITGNGGVSKLGNGTLTLTGNSNTTGNFTSSNGIIQFGSGGNSGAPGNGFLVVNDPGTIRFSRNDTGLNITSGLAGNGNIAFLGNGSANTSTYTLASTNANSFTGWINVEANAKLTANSAYGNAIQGVNVKSDGQLYVNGVANFYNRIDALGSGWLEANSTRLGAVRMAAASNITSEINLISANNLANSTVIISLDATTGNANLLGDIQLGTLANANLAANVSVDYKSNGGELFLRHTGAFYDGEVKITGTGNVTIQSNSAIPGNANVNISSGATFKANANLSTSSGLLYGSGNLSIPDNQILYQFGGGNTSTPNTNATFSGAWTGSGSIEKVGTGNIVFTGTSTANGTVTVTNGNLTIGNSTLQANANTVGLAANATVSIANGATLNYVRDGSGNSKTLAQRYRGNGDIKFWGINATSQNTIFGGNTVLANSDFNGNVYLGNFAMLYAGNHTSGGAFANARNIYIANGSALWLEGTNANITSNIYVTGIGAPAVANTVFQSPVRFDQANQTISGNIYLDGDTRIECQSGDTLSTIAGVIQNNANVTTANVTFISPSTQRITLNTAATYTGNTTLSTNAQVWGSTTNALPVNTIVTISNGAALTVNANMTIGQLSSNGNGSAQTAGSNANFTLTIGNANNTSTFDGNMVGDINYNIIGSNTKLILSKGNITTTGGVKVTKGTLQLGNSTTSGEITNAALVNVAFGGNLVYFRSNSTIAASSSRQFTGTGNIIYGTTANVANGNANYSLTSWNSSSNFSGNIYLYNANVEIGNTVGNVAGIILAANVKQTLYFSSNVTNNNKITVNGSNTGWSSSSGTERGMIALNTGTTLNGNIVLGDDGNPNANLVVNAVAKFYYQTSSGTATINGNISGNGGLLFYNFAGANGHTVRLTGTSNYTGNTQLTQYSSIALAGNGGGISPLSQVQVSNTSILTYENANANIGSLASTATTDTGGRVTSANANAVLTVGNDNKNTIFYGQLNGIGKFTKISNSNITFAGTNGITGNITIGNGNVIIDNFGTSGQLAGTGANVTITAPGKLLWKRGDAGVLNITALNYTGNGDIEFYGNSTSNPATGYQDPVGATFTGYTGNIIVKNNASLRPLNTVMGNLTTSNLKVESGGQLAYGTGYANIGANVTVTNWSADGSNNTGNTFVVTSNKTAWMEMLVVGGGGGGGGGSSNGNGAGGSGGRGGQIQTATYRVVPAGTYNITVGRGGPGGAAVASGAGSNNGTVGANSSFIGASGIGAWLIGTTAVGGNPGSGASTSTNNGGNGSGNGGRGGGWSGVSSQQGTLGQVVSISYDGGSIGFGGGGSGGQSNTGGTVASIGHGGGIGGAYAGGGGGQGTDSLGAGGGGGSGVGSGASGSGGRGGGGFVQVKVMYYEDRKFRMPLYLNGTGWRESDGTTRNGALRLGNTPLDIAGTVTIESNASIFCSASNSVDSLISGNITGVGNLTLYGDSSSSVISLTGTVNPASINLSTNITLAGSGTTSCPITVQSGTTISASKLAYVPATYTISNTLTIASGGRVRVTTDGTNIGSLTVTTLSIGVVTWYVDWVGPTLSAGTRTIIASTGTLPTQLPTTGTNNTGRTITYAWVNGTGLQATLT